MILLAHGNQLQEIRDPNYWSKWSFFGGSQMNPNSGKGVSL